MKKVLSVLLVSLILLSCFALCASAEQKQLEIPKIKEAPTLDGKIDDGEWDGALVCEMNKDDETLFVAAGTTDTFGGAKFSYFWNEKGIYFAAEVADTTAPMTPPAADTGSYNSGDGIQFNVYTKGDAAGQDVGTLLFISFNPKTAEGKACVGEHFCYGDGIQGGNIDNAVIAADVKDDGYVIEGLIPADAFAKVYPPVAPNVGAKIFMNTVVMEMDEAGNQSLIVDNEWFDAAKATQYTFTKVQEADTTVAESEDVKADVKADDTKEDVKSDDTEAVESTAEEKTEECSNTWIYIVIAAVVVIAVVVIAVVVSKKKKAK